MRLTFEETVLLSHTSKPWADLDTRNPRLNPNDLVLAARWLKFLALLIEDEHKDRVGTM